MKLSTTVLSLLTAAALVLIAVVTPINTSTTPIDKEHIFRLHIMANSNSAVDQNIKYLVRNGILEYERELMRNMHLKSAVETRAQLMNNGDELMSCVEKVLSEQDADYSAKLYVGNFDFPDRSYHGVTYRAGRYDALRIVLGDGAGENWWCVMFPPLCITENATAQNESEGTASEENTFSSFFAAAVDWIKSLFD